MLRRRAGDRDPDPAHIATNARRTVRLGTTAFVCAATLSACGGGGDTSTTAFTEPPPLTREEFLAEADRICFATESQIEAAVDDYATGPGEPDPAQVRRVVGRAVVPSLRSEARAIGLLDPPEEDVDEVEAILEATRQGADALAADPVAAIDDPPPQLLEAERLARRYGSKECGLRGLSR